MEAWPFLFPLMVVALVFLLVVALRYISHRERMAMISRGLVPPGEHREAETPQAALRGGLITTMVGLALVLGLLTLGIGPWLLGGLIPLFYGVAKIIIYLLTDQPPRSGVE